MPWVMRNIQSRSHSCPLPDPGTVDDHSEGLWLCPDPDCRWVWRNRENSDRRRSWTPHQRISKRRYKRLIAVLGS